MFEQQLITIDKILITMLQKLSAKFNQKLMDLSKT